MLKNAGFDGIYIIALWQDGGADNGFDVVVYNVNEKFGVPEDFEDILREAHALGMEVGVDVVPNHTSDKSLIAQHCLEGIPGCEDALYLVDKAEAERLTEAGVPSFFGKLAYSEIDGKYVRSTFADYHQLNLNWNSQFVQTYFANLFRILREQGVDFARVDCGMMLLEDVTKADKNNPFACMNPEKSVQAIINVAGGMPLFFEWFDPSSANLFEALENAYALDCSYVMSAEQNLNWENASAKLIPLLGGHDQMTLADRNISKMDALKAIEESKAPYAFLDMQTLIEWKTDPRVLTLDDEYDADLGNRNQRYRSRRPIAPIIAEFKKQYS